MAYEKTRVPPKLLQSFVERLMVSAGANPESAAVAARIHLEADLRGVSMQGVDYVYYTLDSLERGLIDGYAEPELVSEGPAAALIDGHRGLGQPAALLAVDLVSDKAREMGTASVAIRNATDIYMIGAYADRIARKNLVGMVFTSGPPLVHPYGGTERLLSTNPLAIGVPRRAAPPVVLDIATSALSSSRLRQAAYYGEQVPEGTGVGPDGKPTTDAATIRRGAIGPMAGHKGYGLALCIALLCGPMTGSGIGPELGGWQGTGDTETQGHIFLALDPSRFVALEDFFEHSEWYIRTIKESRRAEGVDAIRVPGERATFMAKAQERDGVLVLQETLGILNQYAGKYGVAIPPELRVGRPGEE